jgi:hypothetical protein
MARAFALSLFLILMLANLTMAEAMISVPKPSTPEFTVKLIDSSYDLPSSSSIDPYTGQTTINPALHIDNRTLEFTIKNQPFTPYYDADSGFNITLFYNIRMRGHFGGNWTELFCVDGNHPVQSDSDYTVVSLPLGSHSDTLLRWLPANTSSQIDFQVEAMIGYFSRSAGFASWYFEGEESGWSNVQTITISNTSSPPSETINPSGSPQSPTQTPLAPNVGTSVLFGLDWVGVAVIALLCVVVVLLVLVVVFLRRRR